MKININNLFSDPLEHPPLENSVFPDDRVVLVPDRHVLRYPLFLSKIVLFLVEHGIAPTDLRIIVGEKEHKHATESLRKRLPEKVGAELVIESHDPVVRERLALLGIDRNDAPIMLARSIIDADFVMTLGRFRPVKTLGYFGVHSALYPRFSDFETQARFAGEAANPHSRGMRYRNLGRECEDVASLLGLAFTVQLILDDSGRPARITAGNPTAVAAEYETP